MKVLIAGSTGMVGSLILDNCIKSDEITDIITLLRKPSSIKPDKKVREIIISDFEDYSQHNEIFQNVHAAYFCIGVYTGKVPDDKFKTITVDYAVAFAKALKLNSERAKLCLLSGAGADRTEKSRTSFAKYKGMAENQISEMGLKFYSFRPAYIYPVSARNEPNLMYRFSRSIYPIIRLFGKNASIKSTDLAKAMFFVGINGADKEILENSEILNLTN